MINFAAFAEKKIAELLHPIPSVKFNHGSHANYPKIPNLYIQHGKHSKQQIFESFLKGYNGTAGDVKEAWLNKPSNQHLGTTKKEKDAYLEAHQADMFDDTSDIDREAIRKYTSYSYDLNTALVDKGDKPDEHLPTDHIQFARDLDGAISKHKLPKMTVYSGLGFDPGKESKDSNGVFKSTAFTSCSTDKGIAHGFCQSVLDENRDRHYHVLRINVPDNHKGIYVGNREGPRKLTDSSEHEVLLPRNLHYKLTGRKTYGYGHNKTHVWNAHIVPEGENPHTWKPE